MQQNDGAKNLLPNSFLTSMIKLQKIIAELKFHQLDAPEKTLLIRCMMLTKC